LVRARSIHSLRSKTGIGPMGRSVLWDLFARARLMSDKRKILLQLDTDAQPSVFDRVVAVDAGVDFLFTHHGVKPDQVQGLVHGSIFTRHPRDLKSTAVFVGGSDLTS